MDNCICKICGAGFRPSAMLGNKCVTCAKKYPGVESAAELRQANKPKAETLTDVTVRKMIYEVMEEAGFVRHKCDKCGSLFFKTSPAMKQCKICREKK